MKKINPKDDRNLAATKLLHNLNEIYNYLNVNCHLTQKQLAKITYITQSKISEILSGKKPNLPWLVLFRFAQGLGVSMESVLDGTCDLEKIKNHLVSTGKIKKA